jgi:thymidine kinase
MQKEKSKERGSLTVFTGPMFASKTTGLIRRAEKEGEESLILKPKMDIRFDGGNKIKSHDKESYEAVLFDQDNPEEILEIVAQHPGLAAVLIDEIQFCAEGIVEVLEALLVQGLDVVVAGLNFDYRKKSFGSMEEIIEMAERLEEDVFYLTALCNGEGCEQDAIYSFAKMPLEKTKNVGADEIFGVACADCFDDLRGDLQ